jgi:hypothetical protein
MLSWLWTRNRINQASATIYTLDPRKGFIVARKGTNGFHALVAGTGDDAFRGSWPLTEYPPDVHWGSIAATDFFTVEVLTLRSFFHTTFFS